MSSTDNFIWPTPSPAQKNLIEQSAQEILTVRTNYPETIFADLYDKISMPYDLRQAHQTNDRAVAAAYGFENILDDEFAVTVAMLNLYKKFC